MISAVYAATMTSAVVAIKRLVEPFAAGNGLACRAFLRCGQNHPSKEKQHRAGEYQHQDSDVHPSSKGHLGSALFPRLGSQFNNIVRM